MNKLLFFVVLLIIYGSLYPFKFSGQIPDLATTWRLLTEYNLHTTSTDITANIILFIPLGFVIRLASNQYHSRVKAILTMLVLAAVLAFLLQYFQFFIPARVPDAGDAVYNIVGAIIGLVFSHLSTVLAE